MFGESKGETDPSAAVQYVNAMLCFSYLTLKFSKVPETLQFPTLKRLSQIQNATTTASTTSQQDESETELRIESCDLEKVRKYMRMQKKLKPVTPFGVHFYGNRFLSYFCTTDIFT